MIYIEKSAPSQNIVDKVNEIKRSDEWRGISDDNTSAIRKQFDLLPKEEIRESLLKEQHYLCAYCMKKIENNYHMTIEHFTPISNDKNKALDYSNMLGVCDGGRDVTLGEGEHRILCCDAHKKDEETMTINPMNKQHMDLIKYTKNGKIYIDSEDEKPEHDINYVLQLNGLLDKNGNLKSDTSTQLLKGRKDTYEQCEKLFKHLNKKGKFNSGMLKKRIEDIEKKEKMPEFAGVTLFVLKKKYKELISRNM